MDSFLAFRRGSTEFAEVNSAAAAGSSCDRRDGMPRFVDRAEFSAHGIECFIDEMEFSLDEMELLLVKKQFFIDGTEFLIDKKEFFMALMRR
jgi:hypothetical protein